MSEEKGALLLGTEDVGKLLKKYATPAIIAMTASSLYNMVDSIFIGQGVGPLAISGLAITFPFMNLGAAIGAMVGVGASTVTAMELGKKNYAKSCRALANTVMLNVIFGILFTIICLLFLKPILYFFGASEQTLPYAYEYMQVILVGNIITHLYHGLNSVLRASGHPNEAMIATIITVAANVFLDWLFIFPLGMGIRGAAIATVIAQTIPLIYLFKLFLNKNELVHFDRKDFVFDIKIIKDILAIGLSPFLLNSALCVIIILINNGLKRYGGDLSVGAYGIVNRVAFFFTMVVMGITQGMQPIVSYNYGARQYSRVTEALKKAIVLAIITLCLGCLIGETIPRLVCSLFTTDEDLLNYSVDGMRIVMATFPIIAFPIVIGNFFQSIGKAKKSIVLSLSRQVLFLIPLLIILPHFLGIKGVWWSIPISDVIATILSIIMIYRYYKFDVKS
ncbi:MAG: MATE family efflux transporter [Bacteroidales bacterium]|nr:MATE family efflux transporter [Bacteroidales bacterium]